MNIEQRPEEWRPVVGFEGSYEVSSVGGVRSLDRESISGSHLRGIVMSPWIDCGGYRRIDLQGGSSGRRRVRVHHLVLEAFLCPRPDGMECRHLDGDPQNNRLENLCWGTSSENSLDAVCHGRNPRGEKNGYSKLTESQVKAVRVRLSQGEKHVDIAADLGVVRSTISSIARGRNWAWLKNEWGPHHEN